MIEMKILVYILTFFILDRVGARLLPVVTSIGCLIGAFFSQQDQGVISFFGGAFALVFIILLFLTAFFTARRINERREERGMSLSELSDQCCGVKRIGIGLILFLLDMFFTSGEQIAPPVSTAQAFYDLFFSLGYHWLGTLGFVSLAWGTIAFCRRDPAVPKAPATKAEALTETPVPVPSKPKTRFCKLCGDPIDPVTRKCTGCRKQYFRLPVLAEKHFFIAATAVACVVVVVLLVALVSQRSTYESQIAELSDQVSDLENELDHLTRSLDGYKRSDTNLRSQLSSTRETIERLREENDDMSSEIAFYDRHIVFIADDGTNKYHNYRCPYLDTSHFWAYNTENAKGQGYKPCSYCCG